ncbi:MAG TPA: isoprenylcysteine carboxylmethyltransferase family protein [Brevundimonas sp.]|nr:isoprenylcysteine carboxylmethyltransferase family protein [Brevundimonas sp.]
MTSPDRSKTTRLFLDGFERVVITVLFAWLCYRFYGTLDETPANTVFLISEGAVALFVLLRRPTDQISVKPFDWAVGGVGTMLPMLLSPSDAGWSGGAIFLIAGALIALGAKLSLRRSFGIVAANRGVKSDGLYGAVRHPMYLGYFLANAGVLMLNFSIFNACLLIVWAACQLARIRAEEHVLLQDPAYRAHAEKVRFRLLPLVY